MPFLWGDIAALDRPDTLAFGAVHRRVESAFLAASLKLLLLLLFVTNLAHKSSAMELKVGNNRSVIDFDYLREDQRRISNILTQTLALLS